MNEAIQNELRQRVERIVEPVVAGAGRKRQMREELVGHLQAVFEEELEVLRDERRAIEAAARRLGNRAELAEELQKCVPWVERVFILIVGRKEIQMSKFWMVWIGLMVIAFGLIFPQFVAGVLVGWAEIGIVRYCKTGGSGSKAMAPLFGAFGFFFGMAIILPALAKYKQQGYFEFQSTAGLAAGSLIVVAGLMLIGRSIAGSRARLA